MAFWDSWFGGHDADVTPFGWHRRRFYDNVHSGFLISGSKRRGERPAFSDYARNALGNAGLLGLSGLMSGGWSMPAFLVGSKGFMSFGQGLSGISPALRSSALMDHALGGTLFQKLNQSKAQLTPQGQQVLRRIFSAQIGGGPVNVGTIRTLIDADPIGTRLILSDVFTNGYTDAASRTTKFVNDTEKSELAGLFGLGFMDHWSRTRLHPALSAASPGVNTRLNAGRGAGLSFYQSLKQMPKNLQNNFYDQIVARNPGLTDQERRYLMDVLSEQRGSERGVTKSFHQIIGGAFAVGLASGIEGHLGNTAQIHGQTAQLQELQNAVNNHADILNSLPKHLNVVIDAKTGMAMVHQKTNLIGILGRGANDPQVAFGAGMHGQMHMGSSATVPGAGPNTGLLIQKIQSLSEFNPFVKSVTAHLDWSNPTAVLTAVHGQAALAAGGAAIHPGWAFVLGALTEPGKPGELDVPLPPLVPPTEPGPGDGTGPGPTPPPGTGPGTGPSKPGGKTPDGDRPKPDKPGIWWEDGRKVRTPGKQQRPSGSDNWPELLDTGPSGIAHWQAMRESRRRQRGPGFGQGLLGRMSRPDEVDSSDEEDGLFGRMSLPGMGRTPGKQMRPSKSKSKRIRMGRNAEGELESELESEGEAELRSGMSIAGQLGAPGALSFDQFQHLGGPVSGNGVGSWPNSQKYVVNAKPSPTHDDPLKRTLELGAPAGIAEPVTPHASELGQLLQMTDIKGNAGARAAIGKELDSLQRDGLLANASYFGMEKKDLEKSEGRGYQTMESSLQSNANNFDKVIAKLSQPNLSEAESGHLHAAVLRGLMNHLSRQDPMAAKQYASTMNDLAAEGHVRFEKGGLATAQGKLSQNVRAVEQKMVPASGRPSEELFHGINSIRPFSGAVMPNSHSIVHERLIHTTRRLLRG